MKVVAAGLLLASISLPGIGDWERHSGYMAAADDAPSGIGGRLAQNSSRPDEGDKSLPRDRSYSYQPSPSNAPTCASGNSVARGGKVVAALAGNLLNAGIGVKLNYATRKLAYTKQLADGYYDIFIADQDGRNERPLTVNHPALPNKHQGVPDWHPSGKYLIFVAEKEQHAGGSYAALPGFGGYSDMWLISADGRKVWRLTNLPNDYDHGVLLPYFSRDGAKVVWSERVEKPHLLSKLLSAGSYVIKVADFVETPEPHLANVRQYQPGGDAFYEASGFSPDGKQALITSNFQTGDFWKNQIYLLNLATNQTKQLTSEGYNEHPSFTPDGQSIIYMSNYQADWLQGWLGTDWWLMNPDGSNKRRLTFMNKKGHPHSNGQPMWALAVTWSPDGAWFYGDVQLGLVSQKGKVVKVRLNCQ